MSKKRIIKKYSNRRLYDTETSKYVTLNDLKTLVHEGVEFCVVDAKTKANLTRSILMQIIIEQEHHGSPIFSIEMLFNLVAMHGESMRNMTAAYLQKSIELFTRQQKEGMHSAERPQDSSANSSLHDWLAVAEHNFTSWKEWQDRFAESPLSSSKQPGSSE